MLRITLSANGSLYCCSDGVRGRGAAVKYLSHNASFHSKEKIAPSNRGIKQGAATLLADLPSATEMLGDKGSDSDAYRAALVKRGITPCIPPRANQPAM